MRLWLLKILRCYRVLTKHVSKRGGAAHAGSRTFIPDRRFFGGLPWNGQPKIRQFGNVNSHGGQSHLQCAEALPEARAAKQLVEQTGLLGETITLPFRRRGNRGHALAPGSGVTHSVTHTGDRSKGAERQARYRAKDPDGYRLRHRKYMAARRAKAKSTRTSGHGPRSRCGAS
jgi:hypothetical protein